MPQVIDGEKLAEQVMDSLADGMISAVVNEIFPISVIALKGNTAVLSQGGKAVSVGQRYNAVILEDELTDPQTGRSLGRLETPCCVISIVRVSDQTSYGKVEGDVPPELAFFKPGMMELRERLEEATALAEPTALPTAPAPAATGSGAVRSRQQAPAKKSPKKDPPPSEDANW